MEHVTQVLQQIEALARQHTPPDVWSKGIPIALGVLLLGVGVAVLGAKLARPGVTCVFSLVGGYLGLTFATALGFHPAVCTLVGATAIGVIGHMTFRLWVGVAMAAVVCIVALGVFGYNRLAPHISEFQQSLDLSAPVAFSVPTPDEQRTNREYAAATWASDFWTYVQSKDPNVQHNARAIATASILSGLLLGLLATRAATIVSTAFLGTAMIALAITGLFSRLIPNFDGWMLSRPMVSGALFGGFLVTSLVLQASLSRKAAAAKAEAAGG